MQVKAHDVIGLPVYTIEKGKQLDHTVKDVVYDPQTNRVVALVLDEGGWFSNTKVIPLEDIHSIGDDAVLIQNAHYIRTADKIKPRVASIAKGKNYLTTDTVITEDGTELGTVRDLLFDTATGSVVAFEVSQGPLKNVSTGKKTFKPTDIITVGEDAVIVGAYTEAEFEEQAREEGVTGALEHARQQAPSLMEEVKQKTQELTDKTREKLEDITQETKPERKVNKLSEKADEMQEAAKQQATDIEETAQQKIRQGKQHIEEKRKKDALGQYLTTNILAQDDTVLGKRGDMVTHHLLEQAEKNHVLEQVLSNTKQEPLSDSNRKKSQQAVEPAGNGSKTETIIIQPMLDSNDTLDRSEYDHSYASGSLGGVSKHTKKRKTNTSPKIENKRTS